jgi:hypothetical protein
MRKANLPYSKYVVKHLATGVIHLVSGNSFRRFYAEDYKHNTGCKEGYKAERLGTLMSNQKPWYLNENQQVCRYLYHQETVVFDTTKL